MTHTNGHDGGNVNASGRQQAGQTSRFFKQDLGGFPPLLTKWDDTSSAASLDEVYTHVMEQTSRAIDWYIKAKRVKRICARGIRIFAILGGAIAAGLPTVTDMYGQPNIHPGGWSALILGTIAALVLLDRFFGFSSGWVRFTRTHLQLRQIAQEFQIDWEAERAALRGAPPNSHQISKMLARCKAFVIQINTIVREETDLWIQEFQESLKMLDETSKPKAAATEPGALNLTVLGGDDSTVTQGDNKREGWKLTVDDGSSEFYQGSQVAIPGLLPGRRKIKVEGEINQKSVKDEKVINVPTGGICAETLKLT